VITSCGEPRRLDSPYSLSRWNLERTVLFRRREGRISRKDAGRNAETPRRNVECRRRYVEENRETRVQCREPENENDGGRLSQPRRGRRVIAPRRQPGVDRARLIRRSPGEAKEEVLRMSCAHDRAARDSMSSRWEYGEFDCCPAGRGGGGASCPVPSAAVFGWLRSGQPRAVTRREDLTPSIRAHEVRPREPLGREARFGP
jgi:hypothetical protein